MTIRQLKQKTEKIIAKIDEFYGKGTADLDIVVKTENGSYCNNIDIRINSDPITIVDNIKTFEHIVGKSKHNKVVISFGK